MADVNPENVNPEAEAPSEDPQEGDLSSGGAAAEGGAPDPHKGESSGEDPDDIMDRVLAVDVNGKKVEKPLKEIVKDYQMREASQERFREATQIKTQAEQEAAQERAFREKFEQDPFSAIQERYGEDKAIEWAEQMVWQNMQKEQKYQNLPEDVAQQLKEAEKLKAEKERIEQEKKSYEEKEQERQFEQQKQQWIQKYDNLIGEALEGSDLPKTPETVARMARYIDSALDNGFEPDPGDIVQHVSQGFQSEIGATFANMTGEQLAKFLGDEGLKKIREYDTGRLRNPTPMNRGGGQQQQQSGGQAASGGGSYVTPQEMRQQIAKRFGLA